MCSTFLLGWVSAAQNYYGLHNPIIASPGKIRNTYRAIRPDPISTNSSTNFYSTSYFPFNPFIGLIERHFSNFIGFSKLSGPNIGAQK